MLLPVSIQLPIIVAMFASLFGFPVHDTHAPDRDDRGMVVLADDTVSDETIDSILSDGEDTPDDDILLDITIGQRGLDCRSLTFDESLSLGDTALRLPQNRGPPTSPIA